MKKGLLIILILTVILCVTACDESETKHNDLEISESTDTKSMTDSSKDTDSLEKERTFDIEDTEEDDKENKPISLPTISFNS